MPIDRHPVSAEAKGGTEQMCEGLQARLDPRLMEQVQIIPGRVQLLPGGRVAVDPDRFRILWVHDTAEDQMNSHLHNNGWMNFHRIVCVSYWQRERFMKYYNIPPSKLVVLRNAIQLRGDIVEKPDPQQVIRLIYHTTPHRGLQILVPVLDAIVQRNPKINMELHVYSSFSIYGPHFVGRDQEPEVAAAIEACKNRPHIVYHGAVSNEDVRNALDQSHIFAYPCIWPETSCIALIEAMASGCICVHPDFAVLPETSLMNTLMYRYHEVGNTHANIFMRRLESAIRITHTKWYDEHNMRLRSMMRTVAEINYNWDVRVAEWTEMIEGMLEESLDLPETTNFSIYRTS